MEDSYTHSSYTLLQSTVQIREAVEHVLRQTDSEVPGELKAELASWKREQELEKAVAKRGKGEEASVQDVTGNIAFDLLKKIHQQLVKTPLESGPVYLHELLSGSRLVLPELLPPPRNPDLVKRLSRIRRDQEQKEYDKMVRNVDKSKDQLHQASLGLEVQATSKQLWMVVNFLLTVIGAFFFGFCAANIAGFETSGSVFIGLFMAVLVFIADLYFLVRSPVPPFLDKEGHKVQGKESQSKLKQH